MWLFDMAIRFLCWVDVGWSIILSKDCHLVGFLSCSFDRVIRLKSLVGIPIVNDKSFESLPKKNGLFTRPHGAWVGQNVRTAWHVYSTIHKNGLHLVWQILGGYWVKCPDCLTGPLVIGRWECLTPPGQDTISL